MWGNNEWCSKIYTYSSDPLAYAFCVGVCYNHKSLSQQVYNLKGKVYIGNDSKNCFYVYAYFL